jgi:hypothetical protein
MGRQAHGFVPGYGSRKESARRRVHRAGSRVGERLASYDFGSSTLSIEWMTPFDCMTS